MVLFPPSASGVAVGDAPVVGVHYVTATETNPPLRVYYPAELEVSNKAVGIFHDTSLAYFMQGYLSVLFQRKRDSLLYKLSFAIAQVIAWCLPLNYSKVPNVYQDAPVYNYGAINNNNNDNKLPLILFSHGLTGTGQENAVLLSSWAKQGHVVISVHHTDGSSNRVTLADGSDLWYDPGPPNAQYDVTFRPTQMQDRVKQLLQAREWLASPSSIQRIPQVHSKVHWDKTIVGGFSYGAATTTLLAATSKGLLPSLQAVILLDGWFHVDMMQSAGIEFEMPKEAFSKEASQQLKYIPAILINSEQFTSYPKLWTATQKIARQFDFEATTSHVLPNSKHNNFMDAVFWMPSRLLHKLGAIGGPDPKQTYVDIVRLTSDFLKEQRQSD